MRSGFGPPASVMRSLHLLGEGAHLAGVRPVGDHEVLGDGEDVADG